MTAESKQSFTYVDCASTLHELCARIERAAWIALDLEADSLHHYVEKVCLIQIAVGGRMYLVDPLAGLNMAPLFKLLARHRLILHSAENDLRLLRRRFDFVPRGQLFDTMIAAQLLGYERLGLATLLMEFFGVHLSKGGQKSDWSRRPLTPAQVDYACLDVAHLHELAKQLRGLLRERGRGKWLAQSVAAMVQRTSQTPEQPESDQRWRIKGSGRLDRRHLAAIRELWRWRDREARKIDRPAFWLLDNPTLIELAGWAVAHPGRTLPKRRPLSRLCGGARLTRLADVVKRAGTIPEEHWPEFRKRDPMQRPPAEFKKLAAECALAAEKLGIDPAVLASRATLEAIAHAKPHTAAEIQECATALAWQAELLEPIVRRVQATRTA